ICREHIWRRYGSWALGVEPQGSRLPGGEGHRRGQRARYSWGGRVSLQLHPQEICVCVCVVWGCVCVGECVCVVWCVWVGGVCVCVCVCVCVWGVVVCVCVW